MKSLLMIMGISCVLARLSQSQNIVLKASFPWPGEAEYPQYFVSSRPYPEIDVDNDGNLDVFGFLGYFSPTTLHRYPIPYGLSKYPQGDIDIPTPIVGCIRQHGLAEYISVSSVSQWGQMGLRIHDVMTSSMLLSCIECTSNVVCDYDNDGLDDVLPVVSGENVVRVYGVSNGNPVNHPQDLGILVSGEDYVITWTSVPTATAYRVLWSSSLDGTSFTRIGYTTSTTFTHRHQADQPRGFYRVMSEDNGTGVVRMVGQTTTGER